MYLLQLAIAVSCYMLLARANIFEPRNNGIRLNKAEVKGSKTYHVISYDKKTWIGAVHACHAAGMELSSVESHVEYDDLCQVLNATGQVGHWWTSGNDIENEDRFFWMSNGRAFAYTEWSTGEPINDVNTNCVSAYSFGDAKFPWFVRPCLAEYYFVCEN